MSDMPDDALILHYLRSLIRVNAEAFSRLPVQLKMKSAIVPDSVADEEWSRVHTALIEHATFGSMWNFRQNLGALSPEWEVEDGHGVSPIVRLFRRAGSESFALVAYRSRVKNMRAFPFVQYQVGVDCGGRKWHRALDKKTMSVDDPFLLRHTPPWELDCDCDLISRTAREGPPEKPRVPANDDDVFRPDLYE